jgi:hypothetical protein
MDVKIRLGFLVALYRGRTQSEEKTLDYLLAIHFSNSLDIEREALPAAARRAKRLDWWVAARVITYGKMLWAIDSFFPYKILVWRDISGSATRRTEGSYPLPGQDFSCLPGY